jgi:hypothetical protein
MNYKQMLTLLLTMTILFCALTGVRAQDADTSKLDIPGEDVVLQWNRVLAQTIATPGAHPATIRIQRSFSMMHLAMFDAVNSIEGDYTPYLIEVQGSRRASIRAAAAYAAHDVLVALYPSRQAIFAAELADSLVGIPAMQLARGRQIGQTVAHRMLTYRANDGWTATPPPYVLPPTPGNWQPTPPAFAPAPFTHFPAVLPFALVQNTQFLPPPPPALTSAQYAAELNEVKSLGAANSTTRTAEQTLTAQLWASAATSEVYLNNLVRSLALNRNLTTTQNARLFALVYMATHDALQTTVTSQYTYGRWRPITAIRRADEDGNPATEPDPNWTPLLTTNPFPAYASNAAALTSSPARILELFFGRDDISFQINFGGTPNVIRTYRSFSEMTDEAARSRVFAGIHFQSDIFYGQIAGRNVANYVFLNYLKPRDRNF